MSSIDRGEAARSNAVRRVPMQSPGREEHFIVYNDEPGLRGAAIEGPDGSMTHLGKDAIAAYGREHNLVAKDIHLLREFDQQAQMWIKEERKQAEFDAGLQDRIERAALMSPAEARAAAQDDIVNLHQLRAGSFDHHQHGLDMALRARGNGHYREALESAPEAAKVAKDAVTMGGPLPKAEWQAARELVGESGRVFLPKMLNEYTGRVIMVTDTHVLQQTGRNSAVAHDLKQLRNGGADKLVQLNSAGQLQGKHLVVTYNSVGGQAKVVPFDREHAVYVAGAARAYAQEAIRAPKARQAFLDHVDRMMGAQLARSHPAPAGHAPAAARAPAREVGLQR